MIRDILFGGLIFLALGGILFWTLSLKDETECPDSFLSRYDKFGTVVCVHEKDALDYDMRRDRAYDESH